jgi:hypothetical protein
VGTIELMPFVIILMFAAVLISGARGARGPELHRLVVAAEREQRLRDLTRRLAQSPVAVSSVRRRGLNQRFLMDLGDEEVDLRCFWPPGIPIEQLVGVTYRDDVGWILDVDGPAGRGRVYAWLLDVRATGH